MIRKKFILIFLLLFFLNIALIPTIAQQEKPLDLNANRPGPEFIIHWRYSDFSNNTERANTVINLVENAAKEAWNKIIIQWQFHEPLDNGGVDIYIYDEANPWGVYPYSGFGNFYTTNGTDDVIYIMYNTHEVYNQKPYYIEAPKENDTFLRSVSHEFFHAVQRYYGITSYITEPKEAWIREGTARFVPSVVNPSESFFPNQNETYRSLYMLDAVDYLKTPHIYLNRTGDEDKYDPSIFWRYLYENYGEIGTIVNIFNHIKSENPQDFAAEINSISNALPTTTKDAFIDFAKANYLEFSNNPFTREDRYYEHSKAYYENVATFGNMVHTYTGTGGIDHIVSNEPVGKFATSYVEFVSSQSENDPVYIEFTGSKDSDWYTSLILYPDDGSLPVVEPFTRTILLANPNDYDKIIVMVANLDSLDDGTYDLKLSKKPVIVDVILSTDRSGSMRQEISDAKIALKAFIDLLQDPIAGVDMDRVGLVSFASSARLDLPLTSNFTETEGIINGYSAGGGTNMRDALSKSINELKTRGRPEAIKTILFFTDGYTSYTSYILNTLVPQAKDLGIKIYTLGFGSSVSTNFLKEVASRTGGKYFHSPSVAELKDIYEEISLIIKGWGQIDNFRSAVTQGETVTAGEVDIKPGTGSVKFILSWGGSNLDLVLLDPNGTVVQPGTGGVFYSGDTDPEYYEVLNPAPGIWTVQVYGKDVVGTESFDVGVYQPFPIMEVKPTKWEIDYSTSNSQVFTVSELGGYSSITDVTFTASDLKSIDVAAEQALLELVEAEARGEYLEFSEPEPENIIPSSSFSFTPNNFEVTAGSSESVLAVLTVPPKTPSGNYSGSITVSSNAGNSTVVVTLDYTRPKVSPYELKLKALDKLRNMSSSSCDSWFWWFSKDCRNEHRIDNAISYLEASLSEEYWDGDFDLDPKHGHKVFDYEKKAVRELMEIET